MSRSTEDILEDLLIAVRDGNMREVAVQWNKKGPVYSVHGLSLSSPPSTPPAFSSVGWAPSLLSGDGTASTYVSIVDTSGGAVSLVLPSGLVTSAQAPVVIKHSGGDASSDPVTVTDADGATFDGQSSLIIDSSRACFGLVAHGGHWYVAFAFGA